MDVTASAIALLRKKVLLYLQQRRLPEYNINLSDILYNIVVAAFENTG
jgi:hypothetical protein